MQQSRAPVSPTFTVTVLSIVVAAFLGLCSGALMARVAPPDKFSWAGLAIAPLWLMLEAFFEAVATVFGTRSRAARIATSVSVVGGFYIAWFAFHAVAP